jgi:hypothetical protein
MKTVIYIFNTLMMIFIASINNANAFTLSSTSELKIERYAVIAAWSIFAICLLVTYLVWRKKAKRPSSPAIKQRTRTYEILDHGKRIIVTRKLQEPKASVKHVA